jgi:hypothetical protein
VNENEKENVRKRQNLGKVRDKKMEIKDKSENLAFKNL